MRSVHTVGDMYGLHELSVNSVNVSPYITINYETCSYCRWYVRISWTVSKFCKCLSICRCVFIFRLNMFPTYLTRPACLDYQISAESRMRTIAHYPQFRVQLSRVYFILYLDVFTYFTWTGVNKMPRN